MAPHWPEEVDVFTVPHSRMKKLIHKYNSMILTTDFRDEENLTSLLQNLNNVFTELKAHEHIENRYIMRELRSKLRAASISDPAVCNCHSDNRLTDMTDLVLDGFKWAKMPQRERQIYGRKLRHALDDFTQNFLPHMDMEEEVFQPMLMEYFSYEELKALKVKVIRQHGIVKYEEFCREKHVADLLESEESERSDKEEEEPPNYFASLPNEICHQIFSLLGPQDVGRAAQVSHRWANLTRDPKLWTTIYPVQWASGNWTFHPPDLEKEADGEGKWKKEQLFFCPDEDADVDESGGDTDGRTDHTDSEEERLGIILKEAKMLTSLVKHVLPKVGTGVKECHLAFSQGLSSNLVHKILKLCPNLELLDLRHTLVGDAAFREYGVNGRQSKLRHLDLSGCENITDLTLHSLASHPPMLSCEPSHSYLSETTTSCTESEKDCDESQLMVHDVDKISKVNNPSQSISSDVFDSKEDADVHGSVEEERGLSCSSTSEVMPLNSLKEDVHSSEPNVSITLNLAEELEIENIPIRCRERQPGCCSGQRLRGQSLSSLSGETNCQKTRGCSLSSLGMTTLDLSKESLTNENLTFCVVPDDSSRASCGYVDGDSSGRVKENNCCGKNVTQYVGCDTMCINAESSGGTNDSCCSKSVNTYCSPEVKIHPTNATVTDNGKYRKPCCVKQNTEYKPEQRTASASNTPIQLNENQTEINHLVHPDNTSTSPLDPLEIVHNDNLFQYKTESTAIGVCNRLDGGKTDSYLAIYSSNDLIDTNVDKTVSFNDLPISNVFTCNNHPSADPSFTEILEPPLEPKCKDPACDPSKDPFHLQQSESDSMSSHDISFVPGPAAGLEFLSLSGCYAITGAGISALAEPPGMPRLRHLDLSGCVGVCGDSLRALVLSAPELDHADLYYCDNLVGDPFPTTASGCRNRGCGALYCCSVTE